jgi:hypothetical protein
MEREYLTIEEDEIDDFTDTNCTWKINSESYKFIDTYLVEGDGECNAVIVQRESDKKYFKFTYSYYRSRYHYHSRWWEVTPKVITKTIYE